MRRMILAAICAATLIGCGNNATARLDDVEAKNKALTERVQSLEQQLLDAQKQLIAQKQAMQAIHARQRDMENYFNKMQVSRGAY